MACPAGGGDGLAGPVLAHPATASAAAGAAVAAAVTVCSRFPPGNARGTAVPSLRPLAVSAGLRWSLCDQGF